MYQCQTMLIIIEKKQILNNHLNALSGSSLVNSMKIENIIISIII